MAMYTTSQLVNPIASSLNQSTPSLVLESVNGDSINVENELENDEENRINGGDNSRIDFSINCSSSSSKNNNNSTTCKQQDDEIQPVKMGTITVNSNNINNNNNNNTNMNCSISSSASGKQQMLSYDQDNQSGGVKLISFKTSSDYSSDDAASLNSNSFCANSYTKSDSSPQVATSVSKSVSELEIKKGDNDEDNNSNGRHHQYTSAWTNPQNLATWIDNEVNSFLSHLEAQRQMMLKEKQLKHSSKRKWLSTTITTRARNLAGAHSN